jgi:hypothetical protein
MGVLEQREAAATAAEDGAGQPFTWYRFEPPRRLRLVRGAVAKGEGGELLAEHTGIDCGVKPVTKKLKVPEHVA